MTSEVDWKALDALAQRATQSGEHPGAIPDSEWERLEQALDSLIAAHDWEAVINLRRVFRDLLARDSAWGIPAIQRLDQEAIQAARALGNQTELAHLLGALGHNLHRQGFHKKAIAAFEESARSYQAIGDSFGALKSTFMTSLCYRALNDRKRARAIVEDVLRQVEPSNPWRGNPLQVLAWLTQDDGDLPTAEKLLREALSLHEKGLDSDILVAGTLADLAEVIGLQGRTSEAIELFQRSLEVLSLHSGQYDRQVARTWLKYAELLIRLRRYDDALSLLNLADDRISAYGHYYDLMWRIELARALIYLRKGEIKRFLQKYQIVMRYRRILKLSNWVLIKQLIKRLWMGTGLPR